MRRRSLILSPTLAGLLASSCFPVAAAADEWASLRAMPLSAAIRTGLQRDRLRPETARPRGSASAATTDEFSVLVVTFSEESMARIEGAPAELGALAWLAFLADRPLTDGSDGTNGDGLHKFFYLWDGQLAPQVADALRLAGFVGKAAVFAEAMAMFGTPYPTSRAARAPHFAWSGPRVRLSDTESIVPEPNAFDGRLMALGRRFGPMHALWPDIQTWALGRPALTPWLEAARAGVTDEERLRWLLGQLTFRMAPHGRGVPTAPRAYATLHAAALFNAEMLNGGVEQFFSNSSGDIAPEVADALRAIGLDRHADAVRRGMALYPAPYPRDRAARARAAGAKPGLARALDALTGDVDDGAIHPALLTYARREDVLPR